MKNVQPEIPPFTVPLTDANHQVAQQFYRHHDNPVWAKQVYLNTLTVQAVYFYLSCMGIEAQLDQSMSWEPTLQALINTADLCIPSLGRLECCAILPGMDVVPVSVQVMSDRVGYLAVRLDGELASAEILGFVPTLDAEVIATGAIALNTLQPLETFPDYLADVAMTVAQPQPTITQLSQWLEPQTLTSSVEAWDDRLHTGWKRLAHLMDELQQPNSLAYSFRQPNLQQTIALKASSLQALRGDESEKGHPDPSPQIMMSNKFGKFITLGDRPEDTLLFLVGITAPSTHVERNITVEVYPLAMSPHLPQIMTLAVLDESGKAVLQAEGGHSEGLEFQFSGEPGERFSVKVSTQDQSILEKFEI